MSVRKVYTVLVGPTPVFSGSYRMAICVYESIVKTMEFLKNDKYVVSIAFSPSVSK